MSGPTISPPQGRGQQDHPPGRGGNVFQEVAATPEDQVGGPFDHGADGDGAETSASADDQGHQDHEGMLGHLGAFKQRHGFGREFVKERFHIHI